jgi:hypothetical protein
MLTLQQKAQQLSKHMFVGGLVKDFEKLGRVQLMLLLQEGVYPQSKVLDLGCGCLRGGYWLIHFLDPDGYCGIEPNHHMLRAGVEHLLEPEVRAVKRPRFDENATFDATMFRERFDFVLARSIWSHASKAQIEQMLDTFVQVGAERAVFLTSYLPVRWGLMRDYTGSGWVGRSHESHRPGFVFHRRQWVYTQCRQRGLGVTELKGWRYYRQVWLRITKP